jgi:hypothetical protein
VPADWLQIDPFLSGTVKERPTTRPASAIKGSALIMEVRDI